MGKEENKFLRRKIGLILLRLTAFFAKFIPYHLCCFLGRWCGRVGFFVARRHRAIALESLRIAFPQVDSRGLQEIGRKSFEVLGAASWEILSFVYNPTLLKTRVKILGLENLQKALSQKKGVIALTAHFGNFPLMALKLQSEGFSSAVMVRPMRDEKAGDFVQQIRSTTGVRTIFSYPRKEAVFSSLQALKNNETLILQMDQNFGTGGVWVDFFGKLAATPVGPVVFALRTKSPVIPMFIVRHQDDTHTLYIEEEYELLLAGDKDETVLVNAIRITKIFERWIRAYPEQWGWIHRRWKSRPSEVVLQKKFQVQRDFAVS